jgi:hypothetical protein
VKIRGDNAVLIQFSTPPPPPVIPRSEFIAPSVYNPNSDTSGGWGFLERALPCDYLARIQVRCLIFDSTPFLRSLAELRSPPPSPSTPKQLTNKLIVPPNGLAFDKFQDAHADDGGIYLGLGWTAMPIFGGAARTDAADQTSDKKPPFSTSNGTCRKRANPPASHAPPLTRTNLPASVHLFRPHPHHR